MGMDVYTPAFSRMTETSEWKAVQARDKAWQQRPTVESQDFTDEDWQEYHEIQAIQGRLESDAGFFRHRAPFDSLVPPIAAMEASGDWGFVLTPAEVAAYVAEWRAYLRREVRCGTHLEQWANGFGEPVQSPFQIAVWRFKNWCRVYRLGEGCSVG